VVYGKVSFREDLYRRELVFSVAEEVEAEDYTAVCGVFEGDDAEGGLAGLNGVEYVGDCYAGDVGVCFLREFLEGYLVGVGGFRT